MQKLNLLSTGDWQSSPVLGELEPPRRDPFRYAFLALLAFNVFLLSGGVSFALLYFSH